MNKKAFRIVSLSLLTSLIFQSIEMSAHVSHHKKTPKKSARRHQEGKQQESRDEKNDATQSTQQPSIVKETATSVRPPSSGGAAGTQNGSSAPMAGGQNDGQPSYAPTP